MIVDGSRLIQAKASAGTDSLNRSAILARTFPAVAVLPFNLVFQIFYYGRRLNPSPVCRIKRKLNASN